MRKIKAYLAILVLAAIFLTACSTVTPPDTTPDLPPDTGETNPPSFPAQGEIPTSDPYEGVNTNTFYANYTRATSNEDAAYRTKHHLMSGSIASQDQAPTVSNYQPKSGNLLIKNTNMYYSDDGDTYYVLDAYGNVAYEIYEDGAYVTLDEVAAYVFAFGDVPPNYVAGKNMDPDSSPWGKYLRLNNSAFSGNTSRYPYEPVLPRISGCGGDLYYYEIDIGTTGTDCDPDYRPAEYNTGSKITRGAARIVYVRYDGKKAPVSLYSDRFVFYTYNHYNDFQEYLNYQNGWGEIFGNITGGGTISSKYDFNPTPYVEVAYAPLYESEAASLVVYLALAYVWRTEK